MNFGTEFYYDAVRVRRASDCSSDRASKTSNAQDSLPPLLKPDVPKATNEIPSYSASSEPTNPTVNSPADYATMLERFHSMEMKYQGLERQMETRRHEFERQLQEARMQVHEARQQAQKARIQAQEDARNRADTAIAKNILLDQELKQLRKLHGGLKNFAKGVDQVYGGRLEDLREHMEMVQLDFGTVWQDFDRLWSGAPPCKKKDRLFNYSAARSIPSLKSLIRSIQTLIHIKLLHPPFLLQCKDSAPSPSNTIFVTPLPWQSDIALQESLHVIWFSTRGQLANHDPPHVTDQSAGGGSPRLEPPPTWDPAGGGVHGLVVLDVEELAFDLGVFGSTQMPQWYIALWRVGSSDGSWISRPGRNRIAKKIDIWFGLKS
ncbi:hypothetical protein V8F33_010845 [Rhypophila sp. PSN 637]